MEEVDQRGVKVLLDGKHSLGDFTEAFERQASGRARGKIIVVIN